MVEKGPKAAGCLVTYDDIPRVIASFAVYIASFGYGTCLATVGASIPYMSDEFGVDKTDFGVLFALRGLGYLCGACVGAWLLRVVSPEVAKYKIMCASTVLSGISAVLMSRLNSLFLLKVLIIGQGLGFAGLDTFAAVGLSEMWGQRVQPWCVAYACWYILVT